MQGLSAIRVAPCFSSLSSGRYPTAAPAPNQQLLLLGFKQRSSFFSCGRKTFAPFTRRLKASLQDEGPMEAVLPPLVEEEVSAVLIEKEASMNNVAVEVSTNNVAVEEGPKVNVKFILEKKCHYGQRFNVVGNDPLFGDWEPEAAIPMKWAVGDIWTVEMDVPADKQVEFKFVLTGESGEIKWQPGSNRVFNTVEGISPLVVNEVWETEEEAAAVKAGEESSTPAEDTVSSDTVGLLVPADIPVMEGGALDEVVKALELKVDEANVNSSLPESEPETAPEVPLAELDVAVTAVKVAVGGDGVA